MHEYEKVLNRISNSGTSEGVKKAWESRHKSEAHGALSEQKMRESKRSSEYSDDMHRTGDDFESGEMWQVSRAHEEASKAHALSAKAYKTGSAADHAAAADAHNDVSGRYLAAGEWAVGDDGLQEKMHRNLSARHAAYAGRVSNSGTSEGVKKSWEKRKHEANALSETANAIGEAAHKLSHKINLDPDASKFRHETAADFHKMAIGYRKQAMDAHAASATESARNGLDSHYEYHAAQGREHTAKINEHKAAADAHMKRDQQTDAKMKDAVAFAHGYV